MSCFLFALLLHLISHLLMELISMVVQKCLKLILFLLYLKKWKSAFQHLLVIINFLQLSQSLWTILVILRYLGHGLMMIYLSPLVSILDWSWFTIKIHLFFSNVPYHFLFIDLGYNIKLISIVIFVARICFIQYCFLIAYSPAIRPITFRLHWSWILREGMIRLAIF